MCNAGFCRFIFNCFTDYLNTTPNNVRVKNRNNATFYPKNGFL